MTPPDRPAPISVETTPEGGTRTEVDAVTPREMHAHLGNIYKELRESEDRVHDKLETVETRLSDVRVEFEKRFGRVEKLLVLVGAAILSPKLGGPTVPQIAASVAHIVRI